MSENYPTLTNLTSVTRWPEREFPQERFDSDIAKSMNQMSVMVEELNKKFIPNLNTITKNFIADLSSVSENLQEIRNGNATVANEIQQINSTLSICINYVNLLGTRVDEIETLKRNIESRIIKTGERGELAGSEKAVCLTGSQTIEVSSPDAINITGEGGNLDLEFTQGAVEDRAIKVICMIANSDTNLKITGAEWTTGTGNVNWGKAGSFMVIVASFIGGRVLLTIADMKDA